jgi:hypothetical protein
MQEPRISHSCHILRFVAIVVRNRREARTCSRQQISRATYRKTRNTNTPVGGPEDEGILRSDGTPGGLLRPLDPSLSWLRLFPQTGPARRTCARFVASYLRGTVPNGVCGAWCEVGGEARGVRCVARGVVRCGVVWGAGYYVLSIELIFGCGFFPKPQTGPSAPHVRPVSY